MRQVLNPTPFRWLAVLLVMVASSAAWAHPVSFQGGTMMTGSYARDWMEHEINYTFARDTAVGITQLRIDDGNSDKDYAIPRVNHRFRRNDLASQANLYVSAGVGAQIDRTEQDLAGLLALSGDFETRRFYTLGLAEGIFEGDGNSKAHLQYRIGFAPYLTYFEGISTWVIGQVDYRPYRDDEQVGFTPVLRTFYKSFLLELGYDFNGSFSAVWMYNF